MASNNQIQNLKELLKQFELAYKLSSELSEEQISEIRQFFLQIIEKKQA